MSFLGSTLEASRFHSSIVPKYQLFIKTSFDALFERALITYKVLLTKKQKANMKSDVCSRKSL